MAVESWPAGSFAGQPVHMFVLRGRTGLEARLLSWGATLQALRVPLADGARNLVLGLPAFADYPARSAYFGATVGRYANRIAGGRFTLGGRVYELSRNERGRHTLHGGEDNLARRVWRAVPLDDRPAVRFTIRSDDGDQGFPGNLDVACTYELDDDVLRIVMEAVTDKPTPVGLAHHSYWNLDAGGTIDAHVLQLEADFYLPTDAETLPTGEVRRAEGRFDFTRPRRLDEHGEPRFDHCFAVRGRGLRRVAQLRSGDGRVSMELCADQPGVQLYTGFKLAVATPDGLRIGPRSGVCLETEQFPDAPNISHFPDPTLLPGATYRHVMEHRFDFDR